MKLRGRSPLVAQTAALLLGITLPRSAHAGVELPIWTLARLDVGRDAVITTLDASLALDEKGATDSSLFFAFGAPGAPRALDATLRYEGENGVAEEALTWSLTSQRGPKSLALSGPKEAAGATVTLPSPLLRRATKRRSRFVVRFRAIHPLPAPDETGLREVRLRITPEKGEAPALFRIEVQPVETTIPIERTLSFFCSKPTEPLALADRRATRAFSPALTPRTPGESLCVQFALKEPFR